MPTRKKITSKPLKKKVSKKASVSRPAKKKSTAKKTTVAKSNVAKSKPKKTVKTKSRKPTKNKVVKLKKITIVKPDTTLSCHRCGEVARVNFEFVWTNGWPVCCREGMHIENSDIKIGEVMNKAWIEAGGYGGSLNLQT